ncbi:MAG TPA: histidine phosphatase family protein [Thermosynechococcaceae cyanobacterium]
MHGVLKLLFVRHAQSIGNVEKRMQGQGEYDLTELGRQQAEKLGRSLLTEGLPSHVYSSPQKRAAQTAQIMLAQLQAAPLPAAVSDLIDSDLGDSEAPTIDSNSGKSIAIVYAEELKEFQNGIFQGLTWTEATERYPEFCQQLETSPDWIPIPAAETLQEARSRARQFMQNLLEQHQNGDRVWIITHSWILQHLIAELLGSDRSWRIRATNTALFEFWIDRSRWDRSDQNRYNTDLWQVRRFNDAHHLQL